MKHSNMFKAFLIIAASLLGTRPAAAQLLHEYGFKLGVQFNGLVPATEFWESDARKGSYLARGLGRVELGDHFQMEIGGGYGSLAGVDFDRTYYRTEIIPVDLRILYNFMGGGDVWNPYLYAGGGLLNYRVTRFPTSISPNPVDDKGLTGAIPAGLGMELSLGGNVALDLNVGAMYSFTDNLNYYKGGEARDATYNGGIGFIFGTGGGNPDQDNDGLLNREEKELGTDPKNPDTDGDGLRDGEEVHTFHTDAKLKDTDGDGLSDYDEVKKYHTDPNKRDTDGDSLSDGDEIMTYKTNPLKADTDDDGLKDGEELLSYKTDPLTADTDRDGLTDGDEVLKYKTDPLKKDTDGGSVSDGVEVARGTNPLDKADDAPPREEEEVKSEVGEAIVLEGIEFETNKSDIRPESEEILTKAYNTLNNNPDIVVEIHGYTDSIGSDAKNRKLSKARSDAVKKYLVNKGITSGRIEAKGYGEANPIAPNSTKEGRQKNRRIEFLRTR